MAKEVYPYQTIMYGRLIFSSVKNGVAINVNLYSKRVYRLIEALSPLWKVYPMNKTY